MGARKPRNHPDGWWPLPPLVGVLERAREARLRRVPRSPLDAHAASPEELRERIAAERHGAPFLVYRTAAGDQVLVDLGSAADRMTIGRRATNDIALDWDSQISRVHAALERIGDEWAVMDTASPTTAPGSTASA